VRQDLTEQQARDRHTDGTADELCADVHRGIRKRDTSKQQERECGCGIDVRAGSCAPGRIDDRIRSRMTVLLILD
jgi:hypothetical protein